MKKPLVYDTPFTLTSRSDIAITINALALEYGMSRNRVYNALLALALGSSDEVIEVALRKEREL